MEPPSGKRRYTTEEKRQLVANLDIEVAHRTRQFEAWLADRLENFMIHQEGQVSRIPKQVRNMSMREFGQKYGGSIQNALRGFQKERLVAAGGDAALGEIDKSMRKRKWMASQDADSEPSSSQLRDDERQPKSARTTQLLPSPAKPTVSSKPRPRLVSATNKTPSRLRTIPASPSPQKGRAPFNTSAYPRLPSRPSASPFKPQSSRQVSAPLPTTQSQSRVPSSSTFNPTLPKVPAYPKGPLPNVSTTGFLRLPRKDENMLSENGSPLANPYQFGLGWFKGIEAAMDTEEEDATTSQTSDWPGPGRPAKRIKSSITIRKDPSTFALPRSDSRSDSAMSFYTAVASSSQSHSRENSQGDESLPRKPPSSSSSTSTSKPAGPLGAYRFPSSKPTSEPSSQSQTLQTPRPIHNTRSCSALVAIPTKDGQILEFDPLQTSPGALDALEGISDSAKKQARIEMSRLVQAAVDKWKIR